MNFFKEKYRLSRSLLLGVLLSCSVIFIWLQNYQKTEESRALIIKETGQLLTQQFQNRVLESVKTLENLKSRIEITNGEYFDHWEYDASLIIEQNPSFLLIEWIDSNMVIQRVEPMKGSEEAIGMDISQLNYRRADWEKARDDSITNFTHWLELVQGPEAFLVDAPIYFNDAFQGTITAAMDFTEQFNTMMLGLNQYHVKVTDENKSVFYEHGDSTKAGFDEEFTSTIELGKAPLNSGNWTFSLIPNHLFESEHNRWGLYLDLALGLMLSVLVSVLFFFMQTSYMAQRSTRRANETIRALIESSPMAIYAIDTKGVVKDFWNKAAEEMLGWKREEVMGKFMPHVSEEQKKEFQALMKTSFKEGGLKNKEIDRFRKDGTISHFRLNVGHIVSDAGQDRLMLAILEDITKEVEYKNRLEDSVHEKEVLLSEVHHRVKNNLAIIIGLIELQKQSLNSKELDTILRETQNRIYSIAGVHELLYNTASFTEVTFDEYALNLIERIRKLFGSKEKDIVIEHQFETKSININQAVPLGLLLNELITNSFKHAFEEQEKGKISIHLSEDENIIKAVYEDNGRGVDESAFNTSKTLGVTLIKTLISQLEAEYELESENGFKFSFTFKRKERGAHSSI
ncbi:MAG: PAS domain S-box protein [Gracilimonas sp.]|uniref:histidine kinase dimerization/phosphoacceptor domain -containing protein n=1 Tax=Gracilimonas sp. TaxID=1974203 RepID=UPI001987ABDB|nr:histidine kinase dimerization/phosphoacceptor domain -containing protein [Gracilimonas sp.]MBD3615119.1 PAS domain S-box protein [Gracilimonas sp.]